MEEEIFLEGKCYILYWLGILEFCKDIGNNLFKFKVIKIN